MFKKHAITSKRCRCFNVSMVNACLWMLDDHAHVMQVKLCKANTRGVTAPHSRSPRLHQDWIRSAEHGLADRRRPTPSCPGLNRTLCRQRASTCHTPGMPAPLSSLPSGQNWAPLPPNPHVSDSMENKKWSPLPPNPSMYDEAIWECVFSMEFLYIRITSPCNVVLQ